MKRDPRTGEPIVYEFCRFSWGPAAIDWRTDWWRVAGPLNPFWCWGPDTFRGLVLGASLAIPILWLGFDWTTPLPRLVLVGTAAGIVTMLPVVIEQARRRDFVTSRRFVHQYGLLGQRRREIPAQAIRRVEVDRRSYWPAAEVWDIGDVVVYGDDEVIAVGPVFEVGAAESAISAVREGRAGDIVDGGPTAHRTNRYVIRNVSIALVGLAAVVAFKWHEHRRFLSGQGISWPPFVVWGTILVLAMYGITLFRHRHD